MQEWGLRCDALILMAGCFNALCAAVACHTDQNWRRKPCMVDQNLNVIP